MNLFKNNLLPCDGALHYVKNFFSSFESNVHYEKLLQNVEWKNDEVLMFGKRIVTKRKVAWYASKPYEYTYSKVKKSARPWIDDLLNIKKYVEEKTNTSYNSCLLNLYHDGMEGMSWHCDDEKMLLENAPIASISFGAKRKFVFKHKISKEKIELQLEHGSLLVMKDEIQKFWLHSLPVVRGCKTSRINLTFRTIVD